MPGFDGTGPVGRGPRSGRGWGYCPPGIGLRRGLGFRRGFGMRRPRVLDEREYLEENVLYLEDLKADIEAELAEIKALLKREKREDD
ncbi:MAG TPA: DUF5320 domain-containing protein [Clostridia bacterium]|nr:DUF5320 domain-containing protein [Clostridia bacterium]